MLDAMTQDEFEAHLAAEEARFDAERRASARAAGFHGGELTRLPDGRTD
jgi:hypothetical protein